MRRKRNVLFFGILLLLLALTPNVHSKAAVSGWKTVRVCCGINKSLYLNENQEPEGYCSEYLQDLAQINHWNLEYVEGSWNQSVDNLLAGKIDLLLPTQLTPDREKTMGFSTAIGGYQPIGLFADSHSGLCFDDYKNFDGTRIAVSKGTSNEAALNAYAKQNKFTYKPVYLDSVEDKLDALKSGKVDMIVFSTLNDVENGKVVAMLDYLPFYYCTNKKDKTLLKQLNYGMNQMIVRHADVVQDVFYNFMNKNIRFAYTAMEQNEIKKHGKIVVGIYKDTAPLFDMDEKGNYIGIYVDLIERVKKISGLDIKIKALDRNVYPFEYLDNKTVDFVLGSSDQALKYSDASKYVQSEGIMDYYSINITQSDFSLSDEDNIVFALTNGRRFWVPVLEKKYPNAKFIYCNSSKQCLNAVQKNKADITILNSWEYNYQSKNQRYEDLMEWENSRTLSETVFISLANENKLIRSVLAKSIEQISNGEKEGIITSNLNRAYASYTIWDRLYEMKQTLLIFGFIILLLLVSAGVYGVMRKKSMRVLEEKNQLLKNANNEKDRFLSRMSHELRTPLNAINGYATVIRQNADAHNLEENTIRTQIDSILRAAKYQLAIIGDLLDIQKIESGRLELTESGVDFAAYMENIVEMILPEAKEKNIDFSYERISSICDTYRIDGVRFQQVLLNLLHNAMKFTPAGGKVKMTAEVIDQDEITNTLKFVISDTGIGMSEDFRKNYLFHKFAQEYKGNTSPYEGCGTGLAISREIMHLMGGEITCKSEQNVGSTFTVTLIAKHIDKNKNKANRKKTSSYNLKGCQILLCEDNKMNQDMERRLLERMDCKVDIADDGKIGVDKFCESAPGFYQIVLMDIRMPNMDGLEATRTIRSLAREDAKTVPVVAVSANAFDEDVKKSLDAGMNEHLAKPVDARILYEKIKQYCNL